MTCKSFSVIGILTAVLLVAPHVSHAQETSADTCSAKMYSEIAKQQRRYRSHLYGEVTATGATVGKVLFDENGKPWIKVKNTGKTWMSVSGNPDESKSNSEAAEEFGLSDDAASSAPDGTVRADKYGKIWVKAGEKWLSAKDERTDKEMKNGREQQPKDGIFATKRVLTSELVPYLTQSLRAFQCSAYSVCERVEKSIGAEQGGVLTLHVSGCKEQQSSVIDECNFSGNEAEDLAAAGTVLRTCRTIVEGMMQQEASLLRLATEYDAAYRSILQIAGNFDLSLRTFKWPLINTIRQAAGIIGQLGRVPCLLSACDASPINNNLPPW